MKVNFIIGPGASTGLQFLHLHLAKAFNMESVYEPVAYKLGTLPNLKHTHPFDPDEELFERVKCFRAAPDIEALDSYLIADDEYLFKISGSNFETEQVKTYETLLVRYIEEMIRYYDGGTILVGECRFQHNISWLNYVLEKHGFDPTFLFLTRDIIQILYLEYRHLGLTSNEKRRFRERYEISKRIYRDDPEFDFLFKRAKTFWDIAFVVIWIELRIFERMAASLPNAHIFSYEDMVLEATAHDTFQKMANVFQVDVDETQLKNYVDENLVGTGKIETYKNDSIFHHKLKKTIYRLFSDQTDTVLRSLPSLSDGNFSIQSFLYYLSSIDPTGTSFKFVRIMENDAHWSTLIPERMRKK